jgi:hypothetical protein
MAVYSETVFTGKPSLESFEVTIGKIDNSTAFGTNQVVVMFGGTPHQICPRIAAGMHFTDKPEFGENVESAINGNQPDAGVFPGYFLMYCRRGKVFAAVNGGIQYGASLRRYFIAATAQHCLDSFFCINHFRLLNENHFQLAV